MTEVTTATIEVVRTVDQMNDALTVRRTVFIEEQRVPEDLEIDEHDAEPTSNVTALHVLARRDGHPVGTGRLLLERDEAGHAHIGRVAVLASERRGGVGRLVMEALQDEARARGYRGITLAAQLHAIPFYERLGYTARGDVFLDAGIEHRWMDLPLEVTR
ncbi:MAG: GNAT family N-acetyltransferase [Dehalococcoidia bacterium]